MIPRVLDPTRIALCAIFCALAFGTCFADGEPFYDCGVLQEYPGHPSSLLFTVRDGRIFTVGDFYGSEFGPGDTVLVSGVVLDDCGGTTDPPCIGSSPEHWLNIEPKGSAWFAPSTCS